MKSICVYCGASTGDSPEFLALAESLGTNLAKRRIRLVYGGGSVGLMGILADAALAAEGEVLGIIPQSLRDKEVHHPGISELVIVDSMHERKAQMVEASDGFIAMPGGFGTLDELFETLTWAQLGHHQKPVGILNPSGYFDLLLAFLQNAASHQLVKPGHLEMLLVDEQVDPLLTKMTDYEAPTLAKW